MAPPPATTTADPAPPAVAEPPAAAGAPGRVDILRALERKVLWLASWMIHNANHLRPNRDGLKVGGHQASCASLTTLMSALYFDVLTPSDRVAVKPHASPVFHAIQYLLGNQTRDKLERFRAFGGAQSYPSRTKDSDDVDFSTGSVGLGVAMTTFASLAQDYLEAKGLLGSAPGRMVALVGDAELDEGNVYEALLEGWKQEARNLWWVVDYNRQSLDAVVPDRLFGRFDELFASMGWRVETIKYGKALEAVFREPGGPSIKRWIDDCPNSLYSALVFKGGAAWREHLRRDVGRDTGVRGLLDAYDDDGLAALMTNLGGQDIETVMEAFHRYDDEVPTCFIAYTIKGFGLPFAGHKDNHAGLMSKEQMAALKASHRVPEGAEWEPFAGLDVPEDALDSFLAAVPFGRRRQRRYTAPRVEIPRRLQAATSDRMSTQETFGRIMAALARDDGELGRRLVTASPDVTVSTNLGGWVNRRGVFHRRPREDTFREQQVASMQRWAASPGGQHVELGIAENNLFLLLAALGLSHSLYASRLLPVGTLYDPFIERGLDALNYACYQDARFLVVATPSGVSLAPEGGAHQSITTPLIGMGQDGLAAFEPAYADEVGVVMAWAFDYMQRDGTDAAPEDWTDDAAGGSAYLRLSTRSIPQPGREIDERLAGAIVAGGYWREAPGPDSRLALVYTGAVAPEAEAAWAALGETVPGVGLLAVTSSDRLARAWHAASRARREGRTRSRAHVETLLAALPPGATLVTVTDGHPTALSWLGSVAGHRVHPLGVEHFGQSGEIPDLYRDQRIDAEAVIAAGVAASALANPAAPAAAPPGRAPPAPLSAECRVERLLELEAAAAGGGVAVAVEHLFLKCVAEALGREPGLLAGGDATAGGERPAARIAIAMATDDGPRAPVLAGFAGFAGKSITAIASEVAALEARARAGKLEPADGSGADLAVRWVGGHGEAGTPPGAESAAVLSVGPVEEVPVAEDGEVRIGTRIACTLALGPRRADPAAGARFLRRLERLCEDPRRLLL